MLSHRIALLSRELQLRQDQIFAVSSLLSEGGTVPFIARYRKEATGSLDEVAISQIRDRLKQIEELDDRRNAIVKSLAERDLLTDDLKAKLDAAETMAILEDLYLPFRPKRRTRAMIAREKGLEPLADALLERSIETQADLDALAVTFVSEEKGVGDVIAALSGARDIIAERASEDADSRSRMRGLYLRSGTIRSSVTKTGEETGGKYEDYFEWEESVLVAPSHRILAMFRGEKEGALSLKIRPTDEEALPLLKERFVKDDSCSSHQVEMAVEDGYKRLLAPSMETEVRNELKRKADHEAIRVFAENLRELLLSPPLGQKRLLAIDPGFRTGCKAACLDPQGKLLHHETLFPHTGERHRAEAGRAAQELCRVYKIETIAIGNGTASRETEAFFRELKLPGNPPIFAVNESGASIYSASEVAREEFPDEDVTVRGSVSIGRRLMDPLAELVKIDPKSIGVGQYQHDVDQDALRQSLEDVVVGCVNRVGVEVNTASKELLSYVSGLGPSLARNIVAYRNENGPFGSRRELLKVKGLGPKAFEQAAGFLRIKDGANPLDASAVHPESYPVVESIRRDLDCEIADLMRKEELRKKIDPSRYVSEKTGLPTLLDILEELAKPGRDPRPAYEAFSFAEGIEKPEDLAVGMRLPGIVTNVAAFGAFVDIGVHQDGLVHISQLADRFVKDPNEVVKVGRKVTVTVVSIDLARGRIGLSMKSDPFADRSPNGGGASR